MTPICLRLPLRQLLPAAACALVAGAVIAAGEAQAEELTASAKVRLLFPILTGQELERLLPLAPQAVIVAVQGGSFVEVGRFSDARVAHRLGRTIQQRLSLPFDLAYDQGHPQLALAATGELLPGVPPLIVAAIPTPASPPPAPSLDPSPSPAALSPQVPVDTASPPIAVAAPQRIAPEVAATTTEPDTGRAARIDRLLQRALTPAPLTPVEEAVVQVPPDRPQQPATAPRPLSTSVNEPAPTEPDTGRGARIDRLLQRALTPVPLTPAPLTPVEEAVAQVPPDRPQQPATAPRPLSPSVNEPAPTDLSEVLREALQPVPLAADPPAVAVTAQVPDQGPTEAPATHPWLQPVPIAAVAVGVPISRLPPAVNPRLDYLYVQIRQPSDVARLRQFLPVQEITLQGDAVLARVGVFTTSRQGQVLLAEQINLLRATDLNPLLARAGTVMNSA